MNFVKETSRNLRSLADDRLLMETEKLAKQEREILTEILHPLREIERRRLFSSLGYRSLFDYAVKKLSYCEDQAYRRINAMRLLKDLPEIEEKTSSGELTLTNLSLAQKHFRHEEKSAPFSREEKLKMLGNLENKSSREAEKIVIEASGLPALFTPDKVRPVGAELVELKFLADQNLVSKIEKLKGLLAHSNSNIGLGELFSKLCDLGERAWDPARKASAAPQKLSVINRQAGNLTAAVKREIWKKAQSRCENCGSKFALQIDHIRPKAVGGNNDAGNLRLFCRNCNQRAAIKSFGVQRMDKYLT